MSDMTRQWIILQHIPKLPRKASVQQLKDLLKNNSEFAEISERTIQRDLNALSEVFPIVSDEHRPAGWSWSNHSQVNLPSMTTAEATAFALIKQFLSPLLPPTFVKQLQDYFDNADKQLQSLSPNKKGTHWADKIRAQSASQPLLPPDINSDIQSQIYDAVWQGKGLTTTYTRRDGQAKEYTLYPLGIFQRGAVTYLLASESAEADSQVRFFAMHRFQQAQIQEHINVKRKFDIDEYLNSQGNAGFATKAETIKLEALFNKETAGHLYETPLSKDQTMEEQPDGRILLTATVTNTQQLVWWLLAFGDNVEVKTKSIRKEIAAIVKKMVDHYEK